MVDGEGQVMRRNAQHTHTDVHYVLCLLLVKVMGTFAFYRLWEILQERNLLL